MTCIRTSAPTERAFMTRPQWQTAGRREHVHGRIQANDNLVTMGKRRAWFWTQFAIYSAVTLYALDLWIIH